MAGARKKVRPIRILPTPLSAVAAVLDSGNGFRVVVGPLGNMAAHKAKGERLFVVPGYQVIEPVPYHIWPIVVERARAYMSSQLAPVNKCGDCKACCITPYLKTQDFTKPSHTACHNCVRTKTGCEIYWNRPLQCQEFKCLWLRSQATDAPMAPELRPDKALVILTGPELPDEPADQIYIHPEGTVPRGSQSCSMSQEMADWLVKSGRPQIIVTHYHGEANK